MFSDICSSIFYTFTFVSLVVIDFFLDNGLVDGFKKIICKVFCYVRESFKKENIQETDFRHDLNLLVLVTEMLVLGFTIVFLNKYKRVRRRDKIDALLQESRETLQRTNDFLEKWRLRRLNCQETKELSYLDEEPQDIKPYKVEVTILRHIAIVDALGSSRSQLERGDAGDNINQTDSNLYSLTSLLDDFQTIPEVPSDMKIEDFM